MIRCYENSTAEEYAIKNSLKYEYLQVFSDNDVTLLESSYVYTGEKIYPRIRVVVNGNEISSDDYYVSLSSNVNVGTANVTVTQNIKGVYRGVVKKTFKIIPASAEDVVVEEIEPEYYWGYENEPYIYATYNNKALYKGVDYSITYSSNTYPGEGYALLNFKGNFSGEKKIPFQIVLSPVNNLTVSSEGNKGVYLKWNEGEGTYDQFKVYIYDESTSKYKHIGTTTNKYFYYEPKENLLELHNYKFAVKSVVHTEEKSYSSKVICITATTGLKEMSLRLVTKKNEVLLEWNANKLADGYIIYKYNNSTGNFENIKTFTDYNTTSWKDTKANNKGEFLYYVVAYKNGENERFYSYSEYYCSSAYGGARLDGASLKSRKTIKVYNTQPQKTKYAWTYTLNDEDIKTLKSFETKYFKKGMRTSEKVAYTLEWINKNVDYASGSKYNKISNLTYVNAIFNKKSGQCLQYNGALAAMMAYLGYDVRIIQGYRGNVSNSIWQHFWVEVDIEGQTYIMETGNYGQSGSWSYLCNKYSETTKYIKNCKNMYQDYSSISLTSVTNHVNGVQIKWEEFPDTEKYIVYRKTAKTGWARIGTTVGTNFVDKTAKSNTKYWYTVKGQYGSQYSWYNKMGLSTTFMSAPKISKVENTASGVKVTWGKVSGATTYYVYRKTTGGWTKIATTKSTSYTDTKAKAGTTYTYTIRAAKSGAVSAAGYSKKITRLTVPKLTKLTATSKKNTLTFGKVTGATSYAVYRKTGSGKWVKIATTKSTTYVDKSIKKGTYYTYTVKAVNGSSVSYYNTKGLKVKAK